MLNVNYVNDVTHYVSPDVNKNMKTLFEQVDKSLVDFWKFHNLTQHDFYCRKCNKLLVDISELNGVIVKSNCNNDYVFCYNGSSQHKYVESAKNRWCIKGRVLSKKTYFRHLCWDCLKEEMIYTIDHNDELKLISPSRYAKWKRMRANGKIQKYFDKFPPPPWNSPIWWFRLVFDMSEDELNAERTKFDTASISSFIKRYGEEEGKHKYDEYCKIQAKAGCTLEYFVEKYGKDLGQMKYDELCKSKGVSKKNCIEKYGKELGKKFFDEYCKTQVNAGNTLAYFTNKYGEDEGKRKYKIVCSQKTLTLANFKRKYGEAEGLKKYKSYLQKTSVGYSKISQELFMKIDEKIGDLANDSFFFIKNYETEVEIEIGNKKKIAKLDYELNRKVIEFNGDYWHANPKLYDENDIQVICHTKKPVKDIWLYDFLRKKELEKRGFKVHVVWESDYYENPEKIVDECIKFLKDEQL